ncbi:TPA: hypothetical protein QDB08_002672 [Burkholderia vietnamiensis]|uniref:hypothetical protein n=1 Tax=Burkholderia vietnamiensis TaxID=60552 RepID=UPI001592CA09|nr:hypothetical protein [Burkholderia vietnamiensis]HDR9009702.1 hypothetical protein [Burkholderia vietnamiensis]HDR9013747.1 hypothetical protein [Burkholderia vietnamiensis]
MIIGPVFTARVGAALAPDSLGMQSVNMALYRSVFPGINNTVRYIRVYSALCWMVSRIDFVALERGATGAEAREIAIRGMQKMELLLSWANVLHGIKGMPGRLRVWPTKDEEDNKEVDLRFDVVVSAEQQKLVGNPDVTIKAGAHFMTAPEYRPSAVNGLCFLVAHPSEPGIWALTPAGLELARAFQAMLDETGHELTAWLADPTDVRTTRAKVRSLWNPVLNVRECTDAEGHAFLAQYFPPPGHTPKHAPNWEHRSAGITLVLRAIRAAESHFSGNNHFVPVDVIRHVMGSRRTPNGVVLDDEPFLESAGYWTSLQYRQYIKLALETFLRITEFELHDAVLTDSARDIPAVADAIGEWVAKELAGVDAAVDDTIERLTLQCLPEEPMLYRSGMETDNLNMAGRVEKLYETARSVWATPGEREDDARMLAQAASALAYEALVYCAVDAPLWMEVPDFKASIEGDRLSPAELARLVEDYRDSPLAQFVAHIVKEYVVNLHFRVVRERTEEDRNPRDRYRIVMGDEGLERDLHHQRELASVEILEDRLHRALNLLARAGIVEQRGALGDEDEFRLTEEGRQRLEQYSGLEEVVR